jgi:voltage-gated potassium channel
MLAEGLHVAETMVPPVLAGKSLADAAIPHHTQCTVVAVRKGQNIEINPGPDTVLDATSELILICTPDAEQNFLTHYGVLKMKHEPISPAPRSTPVPATKLDGLGF